MCVCVCVCVCNLKLINVSSIPLDSKKKIQYSDETKRMFDMKFFLFFSTKA